LNKDCREIHSYLISEFITKCPLPFSAWSNSRKSLRKVLTLYTSALYEKVKRGGEMTVE